ncbi:MAG: S1C family serine protease [Bacilli bacterium]|nr:S1C family serine protease [Bacilli bacterium]
MNNDKTKSNNKFIVIGIVLVVVLIIVDLIIQNIPWKNLFEKEVVTTENRDVTITDTGIAESVDKLYNATVVVKIYTQTSQSVAGWGSGVVYDKDDSKAYILTNNHVVESASKIEIEFTDGSSTEGKVVGSDTISDIAVVSVPVDKILQVGDIGKSADVRLGDTVFAIGTPISLSYKFTVTRGILSGKDRMVEMSSSSQSYFQRNTESWYMRLLQIDASINSGNSGGPLANANGEVIGITNSKLSSSYGSASIENMGFAIPIEDALNVAGQLRSNGKVTRPFLGVSMTTVAQAYRAGIDLDSSITSGAVIVEVQKDSASDKAGLKKGDVITKFGDYEIKDYQYLKYYLYRYNVGDEIAITYIRDGKEKTTTMTLKES